MLFTSLYPNIGGFTVCLNKKPLYLTNHGWEHFLFDAHLTGNSCIEIVNHYFKFSTTASKTK